MMGLVLLAASLVSPTHYNCVMDLPKAVGRNASGVNVHDIGFPQADADDWRFTLALDPGKGGKGIDATVTWPKDLIQLAGKHAALVTADGSLAFSAFSSGPCMFTESMCMSLVNLARQADNSIKFVVLPAALASDRAANTREPFVVFIEGSCKEVAK